ncbi:MAG: 3-phosphoshikimate 1-carboxyvinyltransferase [Legionellales bacterium]|nr:3-phosphoshikimate 1-carboxyvinyltransferase [Legionellales bacterium]|tara:strand:+ start:621 stop:1907 length:1287 start_codon:yes stop_codon:yes gene_type:complete
MSSKKIFPMNNIAGQITVPGDKSITHRAILLSAIASGCSEITNYANGKDCLSTLQLVQDLGVNVEQSSEQLRIYGVGKYGLKNPLNALDCGNSGTTMRLAMGLLSGANITCKLVGDSSLSTRPMMRVARPLQQMGAQIILKNAQTAPVSILEQQKLEGICYRMPIASAQVKSAILLAGLYAQTPTTIIESIITRNHTETLFSMFGVTCTHSNNQINLPITQVLKATNIIIPGDFSSAAFWLVAGLIIEKSSLNLMQVGLNPTRTGLLQILQLMGANIEIEMTHQHPEPVGNIYVRTSKLNNITIPAHLISLAIDEFPILFVAAAYAKGTTEIRGLAELRVKETDRISAMVNNLTALGVKIVELDDGVIIEGGAIRGGTVDSFGDHRIAMAMCIAGLVANSPVTITNIDVVNISYPNFFKTLDRLKHEC